MSANRLSGISVIAAILFLLPSAHFSKARAQSYGAMDCGQLWYARNAIYAAKGYCFKTQRARAVFGPGCFAPYGRLSGAEQSRVSAIKQWENAKGCSGAAAAPAPAPVGPPSGYAGMNCGQLWYARNAIYAAKGYCFKTARARNTFGPRCYPPFGKLSGAESAQVNAIKQWERSKGCR